MIRPICKDILFLSKKAEKATIDDVGIGKDLIDTLKAHKDKCVGMAANMIGVNKAIIVVNMGMFDVLMFNPRIISKHLPYETYEGCLSLNDKRKCIRHQIIKVEYYDSTFKKHIEEYRGIIAQIIEHEVDHLNGIII